MLPHIIIVLREISSKRVFLLCARLIPTSVCISDFEKNGTMQIRMSLRRLSGISRPQKRDQTEKYNDKYFGLFAKF